MLPKSLFLIAFLFVASIAQKDDSKNAPKKDEPQPQVLTATPIASTFNQRDSSVPVEVKQFYAQQQYFPEVYGLTYATPQYQTGTAIPRLQPQIVLYGPSGQGQPILINPGNPPGNFLIPQGPGPNVIVRGNPQNPVFPVAGYPKPAHIPPIEKDAEEIPTNPAKIPPLQNNDKPSVQPKPKPEKLETFNEPNQPEQNPKQDEGQYPQLNTLNLRPGQRFFILNGDNIYNYPFEAPQQETPNFKYTNVDPFPQNPPKLQGFVQEPPQYLQADDRYQAQIPISLPDLLLRNSNVNSQPQVLAQPNIEQSQSNEKDGAQQYFRTALQNQEYQPLFVDPQGQYLSQVQGSNVEQLNAKTNVVPPHLIGQFRFTPNSVPEFYQFKDDLENDAVVVDASYDAPTSLDRRGGNLKSDENSTTTLQPEPSDKESESSMAQAAPQGTAIAGPGGVAGSAPKGTAIVGNGGLAVSSPQATAVAGTKDEEKRKKPGKKDNN